MRMMGVVVIALAVTGGVGCFSTASYDHAHVRRVATINARYEAARLRQAQAGPDLADLGVDDRARRPDERPAAPRDPLEAERQAEISASARQRDLEIASGRAAKRARVRAAASAFAAADRGPGPIGAASLCLAAPSDQLLFRVAGCRAVPRLPERSSASHSPEGSEGSQPPEPPEVSGASATWAIGHGPPRK
jgi:hypothetical protein